MPRRRVLLFRLHSFSNSNRETRAIFLRSRRKSRIMRAIKTIAFGANLLVSNYYYTKNSGHNSAVIRVCDFNFVICTLTLTSATARADQIRMFIKTSVFMRVM